MNSKRLVDERMVGVEHFQYRPIPLKQIHEEANGLLVHRSSESGELREDLLTLFVESVEPTNVEPLTTKLSRQCTHPRVLEHPLGLGSQDPRLLEAPRRGEAPELVVRHRRPQEVTEPAGQLPIRDRVSPPSPADDRSIR